MLKDEVKTFNEDNEYYKGVFDFSQPLANLYEKIIIVIDYNNKIIQINIPKLNDSIILDHFSIFAELQEVIPVNSFKKFQNIFQKSGYYFNLNDSMLIVLETFLSNRQVTVSYYSNNNIRK
jgi:hypothetical protein